MPHRLLLAVVVVAAVLVAGLAVIAVLPRADVGSRPSASDHGSANTFGRSAGFDVMVSGFHENDPGRQVTMQVTFRNTSSTQQRADPRDFTFRDGSGATAAPRFDAACPSWTRADLHPAGGAGQSPRDTDARQVGPDFGPVPLCFSVAHPGAAGPTLVWDPDIGLLGAPVAIPLR